MKIISKYKDYYDFAVGYDTDDRKVFTRNIENIDFTKDLKKKLDVRQFIKFGRRHQINDHAKFIETFDNESFSLLCVCGNAYQVYRLDDEIFIGNNIDRKHIFDLLQYTKDDIDRIFNKKDKYFWDRTAKHFDNIGVPFKTNVNRVFGLPVVEVFKEDIILSPPLIDYNFGKIIPPVEMYTDIYNWIIYPEPKPDSDPTNMARFISKGFDKKTSFRNTK